MKEDFSSKSEKNYLLSMLESLGRINFWKKLGQISCWCDLQKKLQEIYEMFFEVNKLLSALGGSVCLKEEDFVICDKLSSEDHERSRVNTYVDYEKLENIKGLNISMFKFLYIEIFEIFRCDFFAKNWEKIEKISANVNRSYFSINVLNLKKAYYSIFGLIGLLKLLRFLLPKDIESLKNIFFENIYKGCFDVDLS